MSTRQADVVIVGAGSGGQHHRLSVGTGRSESIGAGVRAGDSGQPEISTLNASIPRP